MITEIIDNLTAESYAELVKESPAFAKALENDPRTRTIVLNFKDANLRGDADTYDANGTWVIQGREYDILGVIEIASSNLTITEKNKSMDYAAHKAAHPSIYARKDEAWKILHNIRDYKGRTEPDSKGQTKFIFGCTSVDFRTLVENYLSK
jgi:acyl-coenzyme A synthetase/AMP-(fatty) acid ligase